MEHAAMASPLTLEVCVASLDDALAATAGGADRLELNLALELGGLTPTAGLLKTVRQAVTIPVIVMVRPRGAGFCYSPREQQLMLRDAELLLDLGADGVASGAVRDNQQLDTTFWKALVRTVGDRQTVFHRAIDTVAAPESLLAELIELGTTRVLTSGGKPTALEGADKIARLRELAGDHIEIMPAAGVNAENVGEIVRLTDCRQVHGSCGHTLHDRGGVVAANTYPATSQEQVAAVRLALDRLALDRLALDRPWT